MFNNYKYASSRSITILVFYCIAWVALAVSMLTCAIVRIVRITNLPANYKDKLLVWGILSFFFMIITSIGIVSITSKMINEPDSTNADKVV